MEPATMVFDLVRHRITCYFFPAREISLKWLIGRPRVPSRPMCATGGRGWWNVADPFSSQSKDTCAIYARGVDETDR